MSKEGNIKISGYLDHKWRKVLREIVIIFPITSNAY